MLTRPRGTANRSSSPADKLNVQINPVRKGISLSAKSRDPAATLIQIVSGITSKS